jgi:hypothetical protein
MFRPLGATGFALSSQYIFVDRFVISDYPAALYAQSKITYWWFTISDVGEVVQIRRSLHASHISGVAVSMVVLLTSCTDPW